MTPQFFTIPESGMTPMQGQAHKHKNKERKEKE
jgi:hypothetical protein